MTLTDLYQKGREIVSKRPELEDRVMDLIELAQAEIEDGSSVEHEVELAMNDMEELMKESKKGNSIKEEKTPNNWFIAFDVILPNLDQNEIELWLKDVLGPFNMNISVVDMDPANETGNPTVTMFLDPDADVLDLFKRLKKFPEKVGDPYFVLEDDNAKPITTLDGWDELELHFGGVPDPGKFDADDLVQMESSPVKDILEGKPVREVVLKEAERKYPGVALNKLFNIVFTDILSEKDADNKALQAIALAYADGIDWDEFADLRDLDFDGEYTDAETFLKGAKIVGSYNEFDENIAENLVSSFGKDKQYRLARESSVAVYIKPVDSIDGWADEIDVEYEEDRPSTDEGACAYSFAADECSLSSDGELRLWWD